jgi:diguanylate cyclase (GGDEF)-like protein/PAS domain S-box-containing protein
VTEPSLLANPSSRGEANRRLRSRDASSRLRRLARGCLRLLLSLCLVAAAASWAADDPSYGELEERYFQDPARGLRETAAALRATQAASDPAAEMLATRNRLMALRQTGDGDQVDVLLKRGAELARALRDDEARARFLVLASQECPDPELPKCGEWLQEALAIGRLHQAARLQADALWWLGIYAVVKGQTSQAMDALRQAWSLYDSLGLPRKSADALYWAAGAYRARIQASQADLEQARQLLSAAETRLDSAQAPATLADIFSALGDVDRRLHRPMEAELAFRKALATIQRHHLSSLAGAVAKKRYALLFLEQGRDAEAAALLKEVVKNIDGFDADGAASIYLQLATAEARLRNRDEALTYLRLAKGLSGPLKLAESDAEYHDAATEVYLALNEPDKAVDELRAQMRAERDATHVAGEQELRKQQVHFDVALRDRENTLLKARASAAESRRLALSVALTSSLAVLGGGVLLVVRLRRSKAESADAALKMHAIMEAAGDGIVTIDEFGRIQSANVAVCRIFGCAADELVGTHATALMRDGGDAADPRALSSLVSAAAPQLLSTSNIQAIGRRSDGSDFPLEFSINSVPLSGQRLFVGVMRDITVRKEAEEELSRLAQYDSLTGLFNRTMFMSRLDAALVRARRSGRSMALMFIDLDGFKRINDTVGHEAGDAVLVQTAQRLSATVRKSDTVARLAGDEFTIIVEDLEHGPADAEAIARKIVGAMRAPFAIGGEHQLVTISLGLMVCEGGDNCPAASELLNQADQAMYRAKKSGKNAFQIAGTTPLQASPVDQ